MTIISEQRIQEYRAIVERDAPNTEVYKWEAIIHFQKTWEIQAEDFHAMFKRALAKSSNLIFQNSLGFLNKLSKELPEETREMFLHLFNDEIDLEQRFIAYQNTAIRLLPELIEKTGNSKINHQQDERTIAFLLTLHNPENYFLYKDNLYQYLCSLKGVKPKPAGQKYSHFCTLAEDELYLIEENKELQHFCNQFIPKEFSFNSSRLIFQDILYRTMIHSSNTELIEKTIQLQNNQMKKEALNQILYGPPGTGKTHRLKTEYFPKYTTSETGISPQQHFEEVVRELTWWQVLGLALIEKNDSSVSELSENRWVSKKASLSESKNVRATIWGTLQMHTIQDSKTVSYTQRQSPLIFDKLEDKTWKIHLDEVKESCPELFSILDSVNNFKPNPDKEIKRYVFTTFHQSFAYEDFIEGIKPVLSEENETGEVAYRIEDGIFKDLCKRAENDPENQYAIFIDEINRGNVSAIFGELITLIETDKRKNGAHPMSAILPYSKKSFSVPSNLNIIGTMNTADRSVEALDTALRRRFSFVEMLPDPSLLENRDVDGIDLTALLTVINQRIEALVDRDHTIGHAYFMNVHTIEELKTTFYKNIIPLLQEYFYGNYAKMAMVLGEAFFHEQGKEKVVFAYHGEDFFDDTRKVFKLKNELEMLDFESAIHKMMHPN